ncbi:hypothetical protein CB0940_02157 [Cercospora beticola]|uniref:Uncharacterized protein n=1 Tax=Cercospora beticola TaxID=122368 RepID=A0A2G5IB20_CERBT|nr:hypothetical protein CB0940_02157 [Cercospora beticola]PIB01998.1 hypothetical protein CB0940_02157 [Cercospora beticola]WPA97708.1 hypothetical protein RHO25_002319 [Cercospora beticola]
MASRITSAAMRAFTRRPITTAIAQTRSFQTSRTMRADAVISPKKPIGAFRGSLFGFLLGTVGAGGALYYYVVDQYKVSNELLTEDIYALQSAVQRLEGYVKALEAEIPKKK